MTANNAMLTLRSGGEHLYVADATYEYLRAENARLQTEVAQLKQERAQLHRDLAVQEQQTNHWYMKANYTPAELQIMYTRRSKGMNEFTGAWLTPDEQAAYEALHALAAVDVDQAPVVHFERRHAA